jgi:hypothetical protein
LDNIAAQKNLENKFFNQGKIMSDMTQDAVTELSDKPDMDALHRAYDDAWAQDAYTDGRLAYVERIRYARWPGQSEDGLLHTDDLARHGLRNPLYESAPDSRIMLADDIIGFLTAAFTSAFWNAQMKTSPVAGRTLNAAQAGELATLLVWLKNGPMKAQLQEDIEIAAQLTCMIGWCVLHPTWRNRKLMKMQKLTMEQVFAIAQQAQQTTKAPSAPSETGQPQAAQGGTPAPPMQNLLAQLPEMVLDPSLEDAAVEMFLQFFPGFDKREAKSVIRQLREDGEAEFPMEEESSIGPELGVLCPWLNFIMPQEATARPSDARVMFVRMQIPKWRVDQLAAEEEWTDEEFVRLLKESAGNSQNPPTTKEDDRDLNRDLCELVYAFRMVSMDTGAPGVYCTVMSPQVKPQEGEPGAYGKDWFLNLTHGKLPFVFPRLEAADWCITDTRGVCDRVITQQAEMKTYRDGAQIQCQLSNTPPVMRLGTSASKAQPEFGPFSVINAPSGKPWEVLNLTAGSKPELAAALTEATRKECEDRFGLPRGDTPPERSQLILQKLVNNFLSSTGQCFDQLAVLAYQNMDDDELEDILGHKPLLTAEIVARHKVILNFDVRTGNGEFIDRLTKTATAYMQSGLADDLFKEKFSRWFWNLTDPSAADEFLPKDDTNKQKVFKETLDQVNSMALGNKPMLTQMDPSARVKMQFAQQIIQTNPSFQARLAPKLPNGAENPHHDPAFFENVTTYMKNLQHSYQETTLSKAQGKLGVSDVGSFPVGSGAN